MATHNPAFSRNLFPGYEQVYGVPQSTTMTVQGTVTKSFVLLAILLATGAWAWTAIAGQTLGYGMLVGASIGGLVVAMITMFKPTVAPWTAPIYAALEGVLLGAISQVVEMRYGQGIAVQAVSLTCGVLFIMLFMYATRIIRVTDKLKMGIVVATSALCFFYLITMVLSFFHVAVPLFSATASTESDSACSWSVWPRLTCCSISTSSKRRPRRAHPSTWSGTVRSA